MSLSPTLRLTLCKLAPSTAALLPGCLPACMHDTPLTPRHVSACCRADFIKPTNLALALFRLPDSPAPLLHISTNPLTAVLNAPNFTGVQRAWAVLWPSRQAACWRTAGSTCLQMS